MAERRERLNAAIVFLKSKAILVDKLDQREYIPTYRVTGYRETKFAEEVIEIALSMGWVE